ncbi:MAG TPA: PfkB family carbohydrate kinase [Thermoanaerobaculia bacterium]|nr:PfkB family carbohydrate kinase [Thermoanaerobaculia bacterium]
MTVLLVGEVNVDYLVTNDSAVVAHWNAAGAVRRRGGMVWNSASTLDRLGVDVFVYAPHGEEFLVASAEKIRGTLSPRLGTSFRDNICLSLLRPGGERMTVFVPFERQEQYFRALRETVPAVAEQVESVVEAVFISSTEETFTVLQLEDAALLMPIYISLSNVVKYWSTNALKFALLNADVVFLNETELGLLEARIGPVGAGTFSGRLRLLVVTCAERGVLCLSPAGTMRHEVPLGVVGRAEQVGAGDTFAGAFVYAELRAGSGISQAVALAQVAAYEWLVERRRPDVERLLFLVRGVVVPTASWQAWPA